MKNSRIEEFITIVGFLVILFYVIPLIIAVAGIVVLILFVLHCLGMPLVIKRKDKVIGTVKWFRYRPNTRDS